MDNKPEQYKCPSCGCGLSHGKISHQYYCDPEQLEFSEEYLKGYWDGFEKGKAESLQPDFVTKKHLVN